MFICLFSERQINKGDERDVQLIFDPSRVRTLATGEDCLQGKYHFCKNKILISEWVLIK